MRIGVISDTHIPDRTDDLPQEVFALFGGVDLLLHAGDLCELSVLERLRTIAPLHAVPGNRDSPEIWRLLPVQTVISAGQVRIGLIHGTRPRRQERADRLRYLVRDRRFVDLRRFVLSAFAGQNVQCVVFGHSHQPCNAVVDGVLLFNPGGVATVPGTGVSSVGLLEIDGVSIKGRIIPLQEPPQVVSQLEQIRRARALKAAYGGCSRPQDA